MGGKSSETSVLPVRTASGTAFFRLGFRGGESMEKRPCVLFEKKYAEAVECYRKAADAGYAPAQNSLGCCYLAGRGVRKNPTMACHYFQKAADQGDPKGINNVGFCYLYGFGYVNYPLFAGDHSRRAADAGLPEAQYNHADLTRLGMGTARNPQRALEYYRKAADAGSLPAIRTLADWYEHGGNGLARDARKALEWKKLSIKKIKQQQESDQ